MGSSFYYYDDVFQPICNLLRVIEVDRSVLFFFFFFFFF